MTAKPNRIKRLETRLADATFELEQLRRLTFGRPTGPRMLRRFNIPPGLMSHNSDVRPLITEITGSTQRLAQVIGEAVPEGRDQELALTALEEVLWRAVKGFTDV